MGKALGIGGIFFKSKDPKKLAEWYQQALGIQFSEWGSCEFNLDKLKKGSYNVFAPFKSDTQYFEPSTKEFMINLIVDDIKSCLQQVKDNGGRIVGDVEEHEYGKFGWFLDPDGNKIELWEPGN